MPSKTKIKIAKHGKDDIARIFVAEDGSWGDAGGLEILELTMDQLTELNQCSEYEQLDYLGRISNEQSLLFVENE